MKYTVRTAIMTSLFLAMSPLQTSAESLDFDPAFVAAEIGPIIIEAPWAIVKQDDVVAAYMKLHNFGEADTLRSATVEAATATVIAQLKTQDNKAVASRLDNLELPENASVVLEPDSLQILIIGYPDSASGGVIPMALDFEKAGSVNVQVSIALIETSTSPELVDMNMNSEPSENAAQEADEDTKPEADMKTEAVEPETTDTTTRDPPPRG